MSRVKREKVTLPVRKMTTAAIGQVQEGKTSE
jgi:hypothetical protein